MRLDRSSGILMHITSLPSKYGIGDIGPAAYEFVDFLQASGHKYWQLLPLNPTDNAYGHSPYSSYSAFAGNPLLISPQLLEKEGFLDLKNCPAPQKTSESKVEFQSVEEYKQDLFETAFSNFKKQQNTAGFEEFCKEQAGWLEDFSLYKALRQHFKKMGWVSWTAALRDRKEAALEGARKDFAVEIEREKFIQYLFFSQWKKLTEYAHAKGMQMIGDIPFYVNHDSADCWANTEFFKLDEFKNPTDVSGVPPDYFSETGQLWGTPVYDWDVLQAENFNWWIKRLKQNLLMFDVVRLDHFRAFSAYWEVEASEETAINGKWVKTPGISFFEKVKEAFPEMPFIAEDLGTLDEGVYDLIERFSFPGMKILLFAFGEDRKNNPYLPFNHSQHNVVYTGTHDNNTSRGWFKKAGKTEKKHLLDYSAEKVTEENVHQVLHKMALNSVAKVAIVPLQDIFGLGEEGIMNVPGTTKENWTWRATKEQMDGLDVEKMKQLNEVFGRS